MIICKGLGSFLDIVSYDPLRLEEVWYAHLIEVFQPQLVLVGILSAWKKIKIHWPLTSRFLPTKKLPPTADGEIGSVT